MQILLNQSYDNTFIWVGSFDDLYEISYNRDHFMVKELYLPFKELRPLTNTPNGFFTIVREPVEDHPPVVVKEITKLMLWPRRPHLQPNYDFETFVREVGDPIKDLTNPDFPFSVYVPPTLCVWGRNAEGEEKGFIIMKRVIGESIEEMQNIPLGIAGKLDKLLASVSACIPMPVTIDIAKMSASPAHFHNIVIGSLDNGPIQPYYVDTYPLRMHKLPSTLDLAKIKRQKWDECMEDLKARSNGYPYTLAEQQFNRYLEDYLKQIG